jgi:hypothetical protein
VPEEFKAVMRSPERVKAELVPVVEPVVSIPPVAVAPAVVSPKKPEVAAPAFNKHSFTVSITELANIPILAKFATISQSRAINLFLRATLPFDRTPVESESIMQTDANSYQISMESVYSILLATNKPGADQELFKAFQQDISIEICALDLQTYVPKVLGTAEIPAEDLKQLVTAPKSACEMERVVFIYGTPASDREGLIIGKLKMRLGYDVNDATGEVGQKFGVRTTHVAAGKGGESRDSCKLQTDGFHKQN